VEGVLNLSRLLALFLLPALLSCVKEDNPAVCPEGEPVEISLTAANSARLPTGNDLDFEIKSLRVFAFHALTGRLAYNSGMIDMFDHSGPFTFGIMTGRYDFVFITNEHAAADGQLSTSLDGWTSANQLNDLDPETFPFNAFSNEKSLPATSVYKSVDITGNRELSYYDPATQATVNVNPVHNPLWMVEVERLAVRIDLRLQIDESMDPDITGIQFANLPGKVPFFERKMLDNSPIHNEGGYAVTYPLSYIPIERFTKTGPDNNGRYQYTLERIILPSSVFAESTNAAKAITIEVHRASEPQKPLRKAIGQAIPDDYTSPRNLYYQITGNIRIDGPGEVSLFAIVIPEEWTEENISGNAGGEQKLNIEKISAAIPAGETIRIHFWSDQPQVTVDPTGYTGRTGDTEFHVDDFFDSLTGDAAQNLHYDPQTGIGYIDIRLVGQTVSAPVNTLRIYLNASGLRREITLQIS